MFIYDKKNLTVKAARTATEKHRRTHKGGVSPMNSITRKRITVNNTRLIAAKELSLKGYHLLPLKPKNKTPYSEIITGGSWKSLREFKATPSNIETWFNYDPNINIGIITGVEIEPGYKLIVADIDRKTNAGLPITPMVETSSGYHIYFKCRDNNIPEPHKGAKGEIKINGYVVAPPSTHPDGHIYRWFDFLAFNETELADFKIKGTKILKILQPHEDKEPNIYNDIKELKTDRPTINIYSRSKVKEGLNISNDIEGNKELLKSIIRDEKMVFKIMKRVFDVEVKKVGSCFKCPLHSEKNPSTALYRTDSGDIGLKDFHRAGSFYTLPEAYFELMTGKSTKLKGATWLIWLIRLIRNAGIIDIPKILPPKPINSLTENQRRLYKGLIELLEVQQGYDPNQTGAPFSRTFAADWTGIKRDSIGSSKAGLVRKKYIKKIVAGDRKTRKAGKWDLVR